METQVFPCTELAEKLQARTQKAAEGFRQKFGRAPCLAVVLVGENPASQVYVRKKGEACVQYGIAHKDFRMQESEGFHQLQKLIERLNADPSIDGILVQSPLPKGWSESTIQAQIDPRKDADGFHPLNAGALLLNTRDALETGLPPCTPAGVMEILQDRGISPRGKHAVVVGRSNIVGKPMALMLLAYDATVTICHSQTKDLAKLTREADILITALGRPHFIKREHVKAGAVVIDVGISRLEESQKSRIVGDVDTASLKGHAALVTPVPRGVGPMTIAVLLRNTVRAAWKLQGQESPL